MFPKLLSILKVYKDVRASNSLLLVEFVMLQEYLYLLQAAAEALSFAGTQTMFYLAAAVSDFYIPSKEMVSLQITVHTWEYLKTLDTIGNCQRPVFSLGVTQQYA